MKAKAKYVTAVLFLVSIVMCFIRFMGWKNLQLSLFDLVQMGFGKKSGREVLQIIEALSQSQMQLFGYLVLGAILLALAGAVLSVLLRKDAPYFVTVIFSVLINIVVIFSVLFMKQKMGQLDAGLEIVKSLGGDFTISKNPVLIWFVIFAANIVVSLLAIVWPEKKKKKDKRVVYTENPSVQTRQSTPVRQVNPVPNPVPVRQPDPVPNPVPVRQPDPVPNPTPVRQVNSVPNPVPVRQTDPVSTPAPLKQVNTVSNSDVTNMDFHGAIAGKNTPYQGKVYMLEMLMPVYVQLDSDGQVYLTKDRLPGALASIYYVDQYQEYCVTPERKRHTYMASGQPLGACRDYYLARGSEIYFDKLENTFLLA